MTDPSPLMAEAIAELRRLLDKTIPNTSIAEQLNWLAGWRARMLNALPALLALAEEVNRAKELVSDLGSGPADTPEKIADRIVQAVCELGDYTSPDDAPDQLGVTVDELRTVVVSVMEGALPALAERKPVADPDMQRVLDVLDASSDPTVNAAADIIRSLIARPSSGEVEATAKKLLIWKTEISKSLGEMWRPDALKAAEDIIDKAAALLRKLAPGEAVTALDASADRQPAASASRREKSNDQGGERPPPARVSAPPEDYWPDVEEPVGLSAGPSPAAQPEGMETLKQRLRLLSWGAQPLNIIGGQAVDKLVVDTKQCIDRLLAERRTGIAVWKGKRIRELEAELTAALASSEADRAKLTRCLDTQRMIEAENARLRKALEPLAAISLAPFGDEIQTQMRFDHIREARAALAAEGGET